MASEVACCNTGADVVIVGLLIGGVVGLIGGILIERTRAKHARRARDEQKRRTWRHEGASAIVATSDALDLVRAGAIRNRGRDEQLAALLTAQREWHGPSRALMSLAAAHPDAEVTAAAGQLRSAGEEAFDAVAVASALVPAGQYTREQLRLLLEALTRNPPDGPHFAPAQEMQDAWEQADKARANAFAAMAHLNNTLHASVRNAEDRRREASDAPLPASESDRRFWQSS